MQVVTNAVRQLQHAVTERGAIECVELFQAQHKKNGAGGLCRTSHLRAAAELTYQRRAEAILQDENCFRVYIVSIADDKSYGILVVCTSITWFRLQQQYNNNCRVSLELLDTENDETEKTVASTQKWSSYVDQLKNPVATDSLATASSSSAPTTTASSSSNNNHTMSSAAIGSNECGGGSGGANHTTATAANIEIKSEISDADTVS